MSQKQKQKFSGHGSMTKAGKVRDTTPPVERTGVNSRKKKTPRVRYRELYVKRFIKKEYTGQPNSIGASREKKSKRSDNRK